MEEGFAYGFLDVLGQQAAGWLARDVLAVGNLVQLLVVVLSLGAARLLAPRAAARLRGRIGARPGTRTAAALERIPDLGTPLTWLALLWMARLSAIQAGLPHHVIQIAASLTSAWVLIRLASAVIKDELWSRLVATTAWALAALSTLGLFEATLKVLDSVAVEVGSAHLSLLTLIQGALVLAVLMWLALAASNFADSRLRGSRRLTPSLQVLLGKLARIGFIALAVVVGLEAAGVDLTALAVFSGALGVGIGLGLQRIFANLVSGFILLLDKSIKPGDVIAVGDTYGWIVTLGARYVAVRTRDGTEHLIPNEDLIVQQVENWSHTDKVVRLRIPVGVAYDTDVRQAMDLCLDAAADTPRVLASPAPACLLRGFGDSSVDLEVRAWIADPENGRGNVTSQLLLGIWDRFHAHGIEIPFPQRDLHLRSSNVPLVPPAPG